MNYYIYLLCYNLHKHLQGAKRIMFCKVCFDASKPGYNTHNVRDYASNVVCPVLLNNKCNGCGFFGHTTKYCKFGGGGSAKKVVFVKSVKTTTSAKATSSVVSNNMFAGMVCSDVEEHEDTYDESVMDFENDPIIWGVGLTSMVGKRWADVVGC